MKKEALKRLISNQFKLLEQDNILPVNRDIIKRFIRETQVVGLGFQRQLFYFSKLRLLAKGLDKSFDDLSKQEIKDLVLDRVENTKYTKWTKTGYRMTVRLLYKFLAGVEWKSNEFPDRVKWISAVRPKNDIVRSELLTPEEVKQVLDSCTKTQDKAIVSVLYEGGFRIGEFLGMKISCLQFTNQGVLVSVNGKTGVRTIRLIHSTPILLEWLSVHPFRSDVDSFLWLTKSTNCMNNPLNGNGLRSKLRKLVSKSDVKKRVNPHSWRHARATELANHLTEPQMCKYFGWNIGSRMPSVYVHLTGRDVDDAILKIHGLKVEKNNNTELSLIECSRCHQMVSNANKFCSKCGLYLDVKESMQLHTVNGETIPQGLIDKIKELIRAEKNNK